MAPQPAPRQNNRRKTTFLAIAARPGVDGPLSWHAGHAGVVPSNRGRYKNPPDRFNDRGVPFFTFGPALPEPRR